MYETGLNSFIFLRREYSIESGTDFNLSVAWIGDRRIKVRPTLACPDLSRTVDPHRLLFLHRFADRGGEGMFEDSARANRRRQRRVGRHMHAQAELPGEMLGQTVELRQSAAQRDSRIEQIYRSLRGNLFQGQSNMLLDQAQRWLHQQIDLFPADSYLLRQSGLQVAAPHGQHPPITRPAKRPHIDLDLLGGVFTHFQRPLQMQIARDGAIYLAPADAARGGVENAAAADDGDV